MPADTLHVCALFYQWQFLATLLWWILVRATTRKHLYDITNGSVFTRPSWLDHRLLPSLQKHSARRFIFISSLVALAVGGWGVLLLSEKEWLHLLVRLFVALVVSVYHLVESSVTHRHGEYPLLYNAWAMCLPSDYARAASFGIAVHFVWSTGIAKLMVGGKEWMSSSTMIFYLSVYYQAKMKLSRPFVPSLNRWICQRSWAPVFISISTITFEFLLVPLSLFLPKHLRQLGALGMILMHIGIFLVMSKQVGIVFATTLPAYIVGFQCDADLGTGPWWCAVSVALLPTILSFVRSGSTLPENWPSSPVSLFMWSGGQAKALAETLMTKETRIVLGTAEKTPKSIVGLPVIHHGAVAPTRRDLEGASKQTEADNAVHDCVLRVIGFTILQHHLNSTVPLSGPIKEDWSVQPFLGSLQRFLATERRLFETQSGLPLLNAYFVRLDENGNVQKVLRCSQ